MNEPAQLALPTTTPPPPDPWPFPRRKPVADRIIERFYADHPHLHRPRFAVAELTRG